MTRRLADDLDLTMDQAVRQWTRILGRTPGRAGQETYLPVEVLLGQEEVGPQRLSRLIDEEAPSLSRRLAASEVETCRLVEYRIRVGQHRFASQVLRNCGHSCVFCGLHAGELEGRRLLSASHIKPWRECDNRERLDLRIGVAACPTHGAAFDTGLLTINGGLRIHRSALLVRTAMGDPSVARYFGRMSLLPRASFPAGSARPVQRYLDFHTTRVFQPG